MESFTVGAWYVAIDLQLAVIGATVLVVTKSVRQRVELFSGGLLLIGMLFVAVLGDDRWALYFLPAFCAGMIVGCGWNAQGQGRPLRRCFGLAWCVSVLLIGTGVVMDRDAWVVAGGTCLLLATPLALKGRTPRWVGLLERDSYALFLCHYPVILVVGSIVAAASQLSLERAALGLMVAWAISMGLAFVLHRVIELPCSAWLSTAVNNRRLRAMQSR
jgi:peptidoglycan/LPS O-acetylase OafA/YrhL